MLKLGAATILAPIYGLLVAIFGLPPGTPEYTTGMAQLE